MPEDSRVQWRALQRCLVRAGVERTTEALGNLTVNEIFDQLERVVTEDGVVRVRCARGWVSVTASDGFPLCVREDSIQKLLASVPLLQALSDEEREQIAKALGYEAYDYDEPIVKQGDDGDHMYFLEEGQAQADVDGVMVMAYTVGDYFGELALLGNAPRQATVTATGPSGARCLVLGREAFDLIAAKNAKSLAAQRRRYQTRTHGRSDSAAPAVSMPEQLSIETKLTASPVLPNVATASLMPMSSPMPVPPATPRTQMTVNEHMALAEKYYASDRPDDRQRALHHFKVAASLGDTIGRRSLAIMYEHGEGGPVDLALALHYYQLAAAAGDVESDYNSGEILLSEVVEKGVDAAADQFEEAMMHFQRAAERAHPGAMYHLAQMIIFCLDGCSTAAAATAADSAVNLLSQAAENGHSAAERELGTCLFHGVGVDQDLAAAVAHYRSASAAGDAAATYTLGWRYFKGEGTARSLPEAERCFADAAARGHAEAAKAVAHMGELRRLFDEHSVQSPRVSNGKVGKIWDEFSLGRGIAAAAAAQSLQGVGEDWQVQAARPRVKQP
jgi:TPR repeat protein